MGFNLRQPIETLYQRDLLFLKLFALKQTPEWRKSNLGILMTGKLITILGFRADIHVNQQAKDLYNPQAAAELYEEAAMLATSAMKGKTAAMFYEKVETALTLIE